MLTRYVEQMGADPGLVALAMDVVPETIRYLSPAELLRYRVVTAGVGRAIDRARREKAP